MNVVVPVAVLGVLDVALIVLSRMMPQVVDQTCLAFQFRSALDASGGASLDCGGKFSLYWWSDV